MLTIFVSEVENVTRFTSSPRYASAGVLIFMGLIVFDTKYIKQMTYSAAAHGDVETAVMRLSIIGALKLYLDFINLFLFLLRLLGRRS